MVGSYGDYAEIIRRLEGVLRVSLCGVKLCSSVNNHLDVCVKTKTPGTTSLESRNNV